MLYPQSQLEPPIDLEEPLEGFLQSSRSMVVAMTSSSSPMESSEIYFETLWFGEIEKTYLKNPSRINRVFLSLKILLIDGL